MNRREFLRDASTTVGAALLAPGILKASVMDSAPSVAHVAFVKTTDRAAGVKRAIELLGLDKFRGKDLFIKPNFNSSDPTPGSTHEDTLVALLRQLKAMGAGPLTVGDRSGMGNTREVMTKKSAFQMGKELDAKVMVFDELGQDDWELIKQCRHALGAGLCFAASSAQSRRSGYNVLSQDPPLWRTFHALAQELRRLCGQIRPW